ncbi:MAG: S41 family peptidase [Candidatus Hydrogenedentes bacterium]|nr:S41 family peptidase [Candidatus Hydrogenedentota bacterium]
MMRRNSSKAEFLALVTFLIGATLVLTNGFASRIFAQDDQRAIFEQIEPIGEVLGEVLQNYVYPLDLDKAVEGALIGIMNSLDRNSSFIPAEGYQSMREDTQGEFDGIGVLIRFDEGHVVVTQPVPGAPAAKAGLHAGDYIEGVDGVPIEDIISESATPYHALGAVSSRIKGPRGTDVNITVSRAIDEDSDSGEREELAFDIKRGKIPIESVVEARVLEGGIAYIRIKDFKKNTASDFRKRLKEFEREGMKSLILDLRWNPGGLLNASREMCELFLPKNTMVVSTRGRESAPGRFLDEMDLFTEKHPLLPETMPLIVLTNLRSASSSEIVTGALQYHQRALIVGEKTFGKGSVQTIIPLNRPPGSALRLTTAHHFTPAGITIDTVGILPDVEVAMEEKQQDALQMQMWHSYRDDISMRDRQDHGRVTGNMAEDAVQDTVLERAVEILQEDAVFANLLKKYHRDVRETQVAAADNAGGSPEGE